MNRATSPATDHRLGYLDALRAMAALGVAYSHFLRSAMDAPAAGFAFSAERWLVLVLSQYLNLGKIGVVVFFAISGFIISHTLLRSKTNNLRRFGISRFFRLYPIYWLSMIAGLTLFWQGRDPSWLLILANATMVSDYLGYEAIQGLYWTLQIEVTFYLLCAAAWRLGYLNDTRQTLQLAYAFLVLALALAAARYGTKIKLPVALPLALTIMFWACVWRQWVLSRDSEARKYSWQYLKRFVLAMPLISLLAYNEIWFRYTLSYYAALSLFLLCTSSLRLNQRWLVSLGAASYSIYLFHPTVAELLKLSPLGPMLWDWPLHSRVLVLLLATSLASLLLYQIVEKPCIRLGRELNLWLDRRHSADRADATS